MPRSSSSNVLSPNLTPLLDMVLQLITFFMMLVHFGSRLEGANRAVRLPLAPAALPGSDLTVDRLSATLDARGRLLTGDQALEGPAAAAWWKSQAAMRRSGLELVEPDRRVQVAADPDFEPSAPTGELPTVVILRADREASYGHVRRTLDEAQTQGFANFSLVVLRRKQP
jgi:biopolymer transport protein ExbD